MASGAQRAHALSLLQRVRDYPVPGMDYVEVSRLLLDLPAREAFAAEVRRAFPGATRLAAPEAMGLAVGGALAGALGLPLVVARKGPRILPGAARGRWSRDELGIHPQAVGAGDRVLIADDVIASGSTSLAVADLCRSLGAEVIGVAAWVNLLAFPKKPELAPLPRWFHLELSGAEFDALPLLGQGPVGVGGAAVKGLRRAVAAVRSALRT